MSDEPIAPIDLPPAILVDGTVRSTVNSAGHPLHINETGVRNFWRWFGTSTAVDVNGRPLLLFHGTDREFNEYKKTTPFGNARYRTQGGKQSGSRQMFHFTDNPGIASEFAGNKPSTKKTSGPNIRPAYLKITNPGEIDAGGMAWGKTQAAAIAAYDAQSSDSFIVRNSADGMLATGDNSDVFVAFDANQILSAIIPNDISSDFEQILVDGALRSAVNSDGNRLHPSDEYIRNFWRWFDGSVMVDEHNRPRPHYHTTPSERLHRGVPFDEFDPGVNYFSDKPDEQYGDFAFQVYLRIKNPYQEFDKVTGAYVYSDGSLAVENSGYDDEDDEDEEKEYINVGFLKENPDVVEDMMARGFDGSVESGAFVVIFDNDQVVSAIANHPDFLPPPIPTIIVGDKELPRTNSLNEPIHDTDEGIRNFWLWFKDSPLKNEANQPHVFYHGTHRDIDFFCKQGVKPNFTSPQKHLGHFFTDSKDYASAYAKGDGGNVIPVYLSIQNPMHSTIAAISSIEDKGTHQAAKEFKQGLLGDGRDGIIFEGATKAFGDVMEVVVFDPANIKAAYKNYGAFNPSTQSITDTPSKIKLDYASGIPEKIAYYMDQNPTRREIDILAFDDAVFFRQPNGSYIDDPRGEDHRDMRFDSLATIKTAAADMGVTVSELELKNSHRWMMEAKKILNPPPATIMVDGVERQTRDSDGQFIHSDTKVIENFWRWMGNSAVVDHEGHPLVTHKAMHGSVPTINESTGMTHVATSEAIAEQFSGGRHRKAFYVSAAKPFDFREQSDTDWLIAAMTKPEALAEFNRQTRAIMGEHYTYEVDEMEMQGAIENGAYQIFEVGIVADMIRSRGYDGIYMLEDGQSSRHPNLALFSTSNLLLWSNVERFGASSSAWPSPPTTPAPSQPPVVPVIQRDVMQARLASMDEQLFPSTRSPSPN